MIYPIQIKNEKYKLSIECCRLKNGAFIFLKINPIL